LARAAALADAGTAEHRAGNRVTAAELWQQALDEYASTGAGRPAAQLEQQMRAIGAGRRVESRPAPQASAVAGLSAAELRVARLVARGMKNRQVAEELTLSRHTVDSHLRHIFTKLGVCSRVEMTRIIVACGALDQEGMEITTRGIP
jgi:DNA-binding NarL/FixJ family response regulator